MSAYPVLQVYVTISVVVPLTADTPPNVGTIKVGHDFATQVGGMADQTLEAPKTPLHVVVDSPVSAYPVLQVYVTISVVVPLTADTPPNVGTIRVGHDLATQVGGTADHALAEPTTPLHVVDETPVSVYPVLQLYVTISVVVPLVEGDMLPKVGTINVGHDLATHTGGTGDHELAALTTPVQVMGFDPDTV